MYVVAFSVFAFALPFEFAFGCLARCAPAVSRPVSFLSAFEAFLVLGFVIMLMLLLLLKAMVLVLQGDFLCSALAFPLIPLLGK